MVEKFPLAKVQEAYGKFLSLTQDGGHGIANDSLRCDGQGNSSIQGCDHYGVIV